MSSVSLLRVVSKTVGGGTPQRDIPEYWNGPIPWATVKDFKDGSHKLLSTKEFITEKGLKFSAANCVDRGTPIVCTRMAVGRIAITEVAVAINQDLRALMLRDDYDCQYVVYAMDAIRNKIENVSIGSTVKGIRIEQLLGFEILDVPKPEQTKIAEVLSTVDRAIEQTEALIAKQQRIKTGLLQDLLTSGIDVHGNLRSEETHQFKDSLLGRIPVEWEIEELGDFCDVTSSKRIFFRDYRTEGVPFYRSKEVMELARDGATPGELYIEEKKYREIERNFGVPTHGDILVSSVGTLGVCYLVQNTDRFYFKDGNLIWFRHFGRHVNRAFLVGALPRMIDAQFDNLVIGTSQKAFTIEKLKRLKLLVPALDEQDRLAMAIQQLRSALDCEVASLHKLHSLKIALMQDLLTGEVRVTPLLAEPQEAGA